MRACYIDDCREPATYFVHSYPDDVRLCERHRRSSTRLEPFETVCTGATCSLCDDEPWPVVASSGEAE